jgi:hypothetical protein
VDTFIFSTDNPKLTTIFTKIANMFNNVYDIIGTDQIINTLGINKDLLYILVTSKISWNYGYKFGFIREGYYIEYYGQV